MESVMIVAPRQYDAEIKSRLEAIGPVEVGAEGALVIDNGKSRVFVTRNKAAPDELEPERLERITSIVESPFFYSVDFSDIGLCRTVLEVIADDPDLVVDNDHGVMLTGPEFLRVLRTRQNWDWRIDPL
jgi:hypothetical protein